MNLFIQPTQLPRRLGHGGIVPAAGNGVPPDGFHVPRRAFRICPAMTVYETTNHHTIYHWCTSRGLWPAIVVGEPDRIRLGGDDSANPGEDLEPTEWWRWFQVFDARNLMLIYDPSKGWFTLGSRLAPA